MTDLGGMQVLFEVRNAGLVDMDDAYLGVLGDPNVDFTQGGTPPNLPGGNAVNFQTTAGFLADSDPAVQPDGVNPNEVLGIVFNLQIPGSFADIVAELTNGDLRIGLHVQGCADGGSESFVNNPDPEPSVGILRALGLAGLSGYRREA